MSRSRPSTPSLPSVMADIILRPARLRVEWRCSSPRTFSRRWPTALPISSIADPRRRIDLMNSSAAEADKTVLKSMRFELARNTRRWRILSGWSRYARTASPSSKWLGPRRETQPADVRVHRQQHALHRSRVRCSCSTPPVAGILLLIMGLIVVTPGEFQDPAALYPFGAHANLLPL